MKSVTSFGLGPVAAGGELPEGSLVEAPGARLSVGLDGAVVVVLEGVVVVLEGVVVLLGAVVVVLLGAVVVVLLGAVVVVLEGVVVLVVGAVVDVLALDAADAGSELTVTPSMDNAASAPVSRRRRRVLTTAGRNDMATPS